MLKKFLGAAFVATGFALAFTVTSAAAETQDDVAQTGQEVVESPGVASGPAAAATDTAIADAAQLVPLSSGEEADTSTTDDAAGSTEGPGDILPEVHSPSALVAGVESTSTNPIKGGGGGGEEPETPPLGGPGGTDCAAAMIGGAVGGAIAGAPGGPASSGIGALGGAAGAGISCVLMIKF